MKYRVVNYKDVIKSKRFDGSYHNADVNIYNDVITSHSKHKLKYYCTSIFTSGRNKRTYTEPEFGVPFLSNADVSAQNPLMSCKYSSKKYGFDETAVLKGGMILTGRVGAIGQTSFVPKFWERYNAMGSDNIIRIVVKPEFKNGFIYAYLASKVGNLSFWKHATGGVQPFITDAMVGNLPIPDFSESFQSEVDELIHKSVSEREQAELNLRKAVELFEQYIGESKVNLKYQVSSISIKNITSRFKRFDSQYQIGISQLRQEKEGYKTIKISSIATKILVGNRGKREYVDRNGTPFLSSSDMMLANPLRQAKQIRKNSTNIENMLVNTGDILISRSGTVGNTVIVGNTLNRVAVSEHAMKLTIDNTFVAPEYVFAYFRTKQGQNSLQVLPYGSVIITLGEEFLGDIDLPILPPAIMDDIVENIKEYTKKLDSAIHNDNLAIEMVEQEIEKWNN